MNDYLIVPVDPNAEMLDAARIFLNWYTEGSGKSFDLMRKHLVQNGIQTHALPAFARDAMGDVTKSAAAHIIYCLMSSVAQAQHRLLSTSPGTGTLQAKN